MPGCTWTETGVHWDQFLAQKNKNSHLPLLQGLLARVAPGEQGAQVKASEIKPGRKASIPLPFPVSAPSQARVSSS